MYDRDEVQAALEKHGVCENEAAREVREADEAADPSLAPERTKQQETEQVRVKEREQKEARARAITAERVATYQKLRACGGNVLTLSMFRELAKLLIKDDCNEFSLPDDLIGDVYPFDHDDESACDYIDQADATSVQLLIMDLLLGEALSVSSHWLDERSVKQRLEPGVGYFAGSGTNFAVGCWTKNNNARMSVETAKTHDDRSGGEVKFYDFPNNNHNLSYPSGDVTIKMVDAAILKRGLVMITNENTAQILPFPTASAEHPELAEIHAKIAAGDLSASAPSEGMYEAWTDEEKAGLRDTFAEIFGWKKEQA